MESKRRKKEAEMLREEWEIMKKKGFTSSKKSFFYSSFFKVIEFSLNLWEDIYLKVPIFYNLPFSFVKMMCFGPLKW